MQGQNNSQPMLPEEWGNWQLVRKIGDGAYGTVYEAEQTDGSIKARSAVKIITIPSDSTEEEKLLSSLHTPEAVSAYLKNTTDRLGAEVQAMYDLQGEAGIVSIQDHCIRMSDPMHWQIFIRMELLTDFATYQMMHRMDEKECIRLGIEICKALEKCETRHILHRDVKPENIFVTATGAFKLGDFGVAQHFDLPGAEGKSQGTPVYMAPEAVRGETYDNRSDLYSLGMVLYRLMNDNAEPFLGHGNGIVSPKLRKEAMKRRLSGEALPAPANASPAFAQVILKACAFQPDERYASASEMRKALEGLQRKQEEQKVKSSAPKWLLPAVIAAVVLLAVGIGTWIAGRSGSSDEKGPAETAENAITDAETTAMPMAAGETSGMVETDEIIGTVEGIGTDESIESIESPAVSEETGASNVSGNGTTETTADIPQETAIDITTETSAEISAAEAAVILMRECEEPTWSVFTNYENGQPCMKNDTLLIGTYTDTAGEIHPAMLTIMVGVDYVDLHVNIWGEADIFNDSDQELGNSVTLTDSDGTQEHLITYWPPEAKYLSLTGNQRDIFLTHMMETSGELEIQIHDVGWGIKTASFVIPRNSTFRRTYKAIIEP